MSSCTKEVLIRDFSEKLKYGKASLFIGSGISRKAGYARWKDILKDCAEEIDLNVEKESDLITLAEFYVKDKQRTKINQAISTYFQDKNGNPVEAHSILSTFQVKSIWTTNYDTLIERSLEQADITYTVITDDESYVSINPVAKIKVHKIHGNVLSPSHCVITRKDYEKFEEEHDIVLSELKGEMCTNSFLFLGYSFSDIDIQHILSKIRLIYKEDHPQRHFCIIEKVKKDDCKDDEDYKYRNNRQRHYINDMQSYGLNVVLVDSYDELDNILTEISLRVHLNDVLICGAYESTNELAVSRISPVAKQLAERLINSDFRIVSGYGKNLGADIVTGAFNGCENSGIKSKHFNEKVLLSPFPYKLLESKERENIYTNIRRNIINNTRISVFICGEKTSKSKAVINSKGGIEEYRISTENNNLIIPVATTGNAARYIWDNENKINSFSSKFDEFQELDKETNPERIVDLVMKMIEAYTQKYN